MSIQFLKELVTIDTPILQLQKNENEIEKQEILKMPSYYSKRNEYMENMYQINNQWYFYKKENSNYGYPFYLMDELLGTYLAKTIHLKTITFSIATVENQLGIASLNFKKKWIFLSLFRTD